MNGPSVFRSALLVDTGGVLGLCAIALVHPRSRVAIKRAAVGLAGVALAYSALHFVSAAYDNAQAANRGCGRATALIAAGLLITAGLLINSVGAARLLSTPGTGGERPSGSSALTWMLLLGGNILSAIYLAAVRAMARSRT